MRIRDFLLVVLVLMLFSCNTTQQQEESNQAFDTTALFNEYLSRTFKLQIPNKSHCYYFIAGSGCNDCIKQIVSYTKSIIKDIDTNYVTFISANSNFYNNIDFLKLKIDSFNYINEYAFGIINVSLVYTSRNKVDSIVYLKWGDENKIPMLLKNK